MRNGFWGHPQYKLPPRSQPDGVLPTLSKLSISNVKSQKFTRSLAVQTRHPNWIVGGMPSAINIDESGADQGSKYGTPEAWCSGSSAARQASLTT
ncbi:hypothetical protein ACNKHN_05460 [Shigella flexneri]